MNEDYLWDKSGQPDPEIQQLEEILGTLRYQPRPLIVPRDLVVSRRRNYLPLLAIAATVLLALLAAGVWVATRTPNQSQPQQANQTSVPTPVEPKTPSRDPETIPAPNKNGIALSSKRRNKSSFVALRQREREEAMAVKEQLMLALRLASEKLSLAQRKTQSTTPANQIKNQHRIG